VRQAIAFALNRQELIATLWHGQARIANTLLPEGHWAAASDSELPQYPHDVARAVALLDGAGLKPDTHGVRLRLTMKTSTDESTRLIAQAMQQELHAAGIALELRPAEFGTFYSDIARGAFQLYMLRWIGSNEDPDFLRYAYGSANFPPKGGNRGHYVNPRVDALLDDAETQTDEAARRRAYVEVQRILATDLPSIPLWYPNNEVVHSQRVSGVRLDPGGTFDFLRGAALQ
jgi:peptide/nickel transport system substrate-binding protein